MARFITTPHVCVSAFVHLQNKIRLSYLGAVRPLAFVLSTVHVRTFACCDDLLQLGIMIIITTFNLILLGPPLKQQHKLTDEAIIGLEEGVTSSSLLWLPERSSWFEEELSGSTRVLVATIKSEEVVIMVEEVTIRLEEEQVETGSITTSLATSPSGRTS